MTLLLPFFISAVDFAKALGFWVSLAMVNCYQCTRWTCSHVKYEEQTPFFCSLIWSPMLINTLSIIVRIGALWPLPLIGGIVASLLYSCSSNACQIFFANLMVNYLTENRAVRELFKYCFNFVCKVFDRVHLDGFFLCITIVFVLFKCLSMII